MRMPGPCNAVAASLLALAVPALATEGGGSVWPLGGETNGAGIMPPPGFMLKIRAVDYRADSVLDGNGEPRPGISGFDLRFTGLGAQGQYVWRGVELWGANLMTQVAVALADARIGFVVNTPRGDVQRQDSSSGLTDLFVGPLLLGWRSEKLHQIAGLQVVLPTGKYNPSRIANPGRGHGAFVPTYAFTWFPTKATEANMSAALVFNRENPDTRYRGGREIAVDYGLGYAVAPGWQAGVTGFLYKQVSDDEASGQAVPGGNRGQAYAAGPFVRRLGRGWSVILKWQREFSVENRSSGERWMLHWGYKF